MKSNYSLRAAIAAAGLAAALVASHALAQDKAATQSATELPGSHTLTVDRQEILRNSKVGKDITRQEDIFTDQEDADFGGENDALRAEAQTLQQQLPTLTQDVRTQKIKAYRDKQTAFRQKVQSRLSQIQAVTSQARERVEAAVAPIIQDIMRERGADLVIEKAMVVTSKAGLDITSIAMQRLDQKLSKMTVEQPKTPHAAPEKKQ